MQQNIVSKGRQINDIINIKTRQRKAYKRRKKEEKRKKKMVSVRRSQANRVKVSWYQKLLITFIVILIVASCTIVLLHGTDPISFAGDEVEYL